MTTDSTSDDNRRQDDNPEPKRKRLVQACDVCRRKKIKCDGIRPTCSNCTKADSECIYNPTVKKRGPRQGYIEMLEKRLDKMEKMLSQGNDPAPSHQHPSMNSSISEELVSPTSAGDPHHNQLRVPPSAGGGVNETIYNNEQQQQPATDSSNSMYSSGKHSPPSGESLLPSTDIIFHLVHLYFEYIYSYASIFDKETLIQDIHEQRCPEFLVLAILSVSARYSDRPDIREEPPWHSGEKYASKARSMVITAIDNPCLANIQGLYLLTLHEYGCARGPRSWMYSGMAVRMALDIGLNREPLHENTGSRLSKARWTEHEVQRRVFWTVFSMDRFLSSSTSRPPILHEEDCEVLLPCNEEGWRDCQFYTESVTGETTVVFNVRALSDSNLPVISMNVDPLSSSAADGNGGDHRQLSSHAILHRGTSILGKVTIFINRKSRQRKLFTPAGPGSEFAKLDQEIEAWLDCLPPDLKYTSHNINRIRQGQLPDSGRFQLIHVLYNTMVVLLHRPALALLDSLSEVSQPNEREWCSASAEKCMRAVDNVTELVSYIKDRKVLISPFLTYLTYTVATIVVNNIFFGKPEGVSKSRNALSEHFTLLQNMRSYWAMADKLYFMIRDLYAMHTNYLRQQQMITPAKKAQQADAEWKRTTSTVSNVRMASESAVRQQWPVIHEGPVTLPNAQPLNMGIDSFTDYSPEQPPTSDALLRGMSLADLSLSTSDGISCSNWILDDNSKIFATAMQSLGKIPAAYSTFFNVPSLPFDDPVTAATVASAGPGTASTSNETRWSPYDYNGASSHHHHHQRSV